MIIQENILYLNGKVIKLKKEGKHADNKEKCPITAANFLGKILQFSKNLYLFCVCLIQLIQAAERAGNKAESLLLFYKLNVGK